MLRVAVQKLLAGEGLNTAERVSVLDGGPALVGRTLAMLPKTNILRCSRHLQVLCTLYPTRPSRRSTHPPPLAAVTVPVQPSHTRTHVHLCSSMLFFVLAQEELVRKSAPQQDQELFAALIKLPPGHIDMAENLYR